MPGAGLLGRCLRKAEDFCCYASLILLVLLPVAEVIARKALKSGVPSSSSLMTHLLLALGLFSGIITTREGEHLSISLVQYLREESRLRSFCAVVSGLVSTLVLTVLFWCSLSFVRIGLTGRLVGFIPDRVFASVIPLGYALMAFRFARRIPLRGPLPLLAVLLGTAAAFPVIAKFIWGFDVSDAVYDLIELSAALAWNLRLPVILALILAAFMGTPLFVVIGALALILIRADGGEIDVAANEIYTALTQNSIIAIPLFTLAGFLLSESRAGERLVA
ncbi:MAG: TRAP transporter small permease, partial [Spirochaetaceae bacterium]|nr:TRAP transporter small permease [Spirochaetaceae bacterium]